MSFKEVKTINLDTVTINNQPYPPLHDGILMVPTTTNASFSIPLSSVSNGVASQLETSNPGLTFNPATNLLEINNLHIGEIPTSTLQTGTYIDWDITNPLQTVVGYISSLNIFLVGVGGTAGVTDADLLLTNQSTVAKRVILTNQSPAGSTSVDSLGQTAITE